MEVLAKALGACVVLPTAVLVTALLIRLRKERMLRHTVLFVVLACVWIPVAFAFISEAWWLLVEEPRRIQEGLPIE